MHRRFVWGWLMAALTCIAAGCGGASAGDSWSAASGRIDDRAATLAPTDHCSRAGVSAGGGGDLLAPPVPSVEAKLEGWTLTVHWRFLRMPAECRATLILVTANSVDDLDNMAGAGGGGGIVIHGNEGSVSFDAPMLDLPPYEARVSAQLDNGLRSPVTTVPVGGSGPACSDSKPVSACVAAAHDLFQRCLTGATSRARCNPKAWRSQPPLSVEPLQGVSQRDLERSLAAMAARLATGSVEVVDWSVRCDGTDSCRVSWWNRGRAETRFTIAYTMSAGSGGGQGCWIAARYRIVSAPSDPSALSVLQSWGNAFTRPSGCTSWQ
jgi:hypothetical protein